MNQQEAEAQSSVALDGDTRRACNNENCLKDYGHAEACTPLTVEQACEILNEDGFEGWSNWQENGGDACSMEGDDFPVPTIHSANMRIITGSRAIAIAQGIRDRRELAALRKAVTNIKHGAETECGCDDHSSGTCCNQAGEFCAYCQSSAALLATEQKEGG